MKIVSTKKLALSVATASALCGLGMSVANAHPVEKEGYLIDTRNNVVKNSYNECWRTGYWTPAMAIAECDPDLVKPAPVTKAQPKTEAAPPPPVKSDDVKPKPEEPKAPKAEEPKAPKAEEPKAPAAVPPAPPAPPPKAPVKPAAQTMQPGYYNPGSGMMPYLPYQGDMQYRMPYQGNGMMPYQGQMMPYQGNGMIPYQGQMMPYQGEMMPYQGETPYQGNGGMPYMPGMMPAMQMPSVQYTPYTPTMTPYMPDKPVVPTMIPYTPDMPTTPLPPMEQMTYTVPDQKPDFGPDKPAVKAEFWAEALFDFDKSVVKPEGKQALYDYIVVPMREHPEVEMLLVTGHTDRIGTAKYNQKLSERRAAAVKAYLVEQGIPAARIHTVGKGESEPNPNANTKKECRHMPAKQLIACLQPDRRVMVEPEVQVPVAK